MCATAIECVCVCSCMCVKVCKSFMTKGSRFPFWRQMWWVKFVSFPGFILKTVFFALYCLIHWNPYTNSIMPNNDYMYGRHILSYLSNFMHTKKLYELSIGGKECKTSNKNIPTFKTTTSTWENNKGKQISINSMYILIALYPTYSNLL